MSRILQMSFSIIRGWMFRAMNSLHWSIITMLLMARLSLLKNSIKKGAIMNGNHWRRCCSSWSMDRSLLLSLSLYSSSEESEFYTPYQASYDIRFAVNWMHGVNICMRFQCLRERKDKRHCRDGLFCFSRCFQSSIRTTGDANSNTGTGLNASEHDYVRSSPLLSFSPFLFIRFDF